MMTDIPPPFNAPWFLFIFGFVIGACLGSFTTMLAYRLPRGISIVAPRSHCPSCKAPLGARDLVPVLSWLVGKGRCRHCNAPIGLRYLWIELAISLGCAAVTVALGLRPGLIIVYAFVIACVLGIARITDGLREK